MIIKKKEKSKYNFETKIMSSLMNIVKNSNTTCTQNISKDHRNNTKSSDINTNQNTCKNDDTRVITEKISNINLQPTNQTQQSSEQTDFITNNLICTFCNNSNQPATPTNSIINQVDSTVECDSCKTSPINTVNSNCDKLSIYTSLPNFNPLDDMQDYSLAGSNSFPSVRNNFQNEDNDRYIIEDQDDNQELITNHPKRNSTTSNKTIHNMINIHKSISPNISPTGSLPSYPNYQFNSDQIHINNNIINLKKEARESNKTRIRNNSSTTTSHCNLADQSKPIINSTTELVSNNVFENHQKSIERSISQVSNDQTPQISPIREELNIKNGRDREISPIRPSPGHTPKIRQQNNNENNNSNESTPTSCIHRRKTISPPNTPIPINDQLMDEKAREKLLNDHNNSIVENSKYKVRSIDMTKKLMEWIFLRVEQAFENFEQRNTPNNPLVLDTEIAKFVKKKLDEKFGQAWHVIVGKSYGSSTSHQSGSFIYFYMKGYAFLIWKTTQSNNRN